MLFNVLSYATLQQYSGSAVINFDLGHIFKNPEIITENLLPGTCTGYVKDETVVRVRGLPWQVSDHEVASFFRGLNISR